MCFFCLVGFFWGGAVHTRIWWGGNCSPFPHATLSLYLTKEAVEGGTVKQDLALETSYLFSVHPSPSLTLRYSSTEMLYWKKKNQALE